MKNSPFQDQVAVVTGAGSGIGRALAIQLCREGCRLAISDIDEAAVMRMAAELPGEVYAEALDVSDREAVFQHAESVAERFGRVDIVINNAGANLSQWIGELDFDDFEWLMGVNFWGAVYATKAFLPGMVERGSGVVVNVASVLALYALPAQGAYVASKFALRGFTETLRNELWDTGVDALCVYPGAVATDVVRHSRFYADDTGRHDKAAMIDEFSVMARTSAEDAAAIICRGIRRRKPRILVGDDARFADRLQRLFPASYFRAVRFMTPLVRRAVARKVAKRAGGNT